MSDALECTDECGGNGYIDCWACGGDGFVMTADDDMTDIETACMYCDARGGWPCPACVARENGDLSR